MQLFYQLRGDMVLKVVENGKHKDVHIREGEVGLFSGPRTQSYNVVLPYYVDNTTDVLFEKWFYCEDLGTQLVPIIQEFLNSEQHKTGKPNPDEPIAQQPFQLNTMNVMTPFSFRRWMDKGRSELDQGRALNMFGAQFETEVLMGAR
ncbi:hypothetical protein Z043_104804 [Scleropages formosus]|uniref:Uncharacterized protein n=1 Tax=Scleropages formosus TaxID=113540 RepID=A0A0P7VJK6_SCLFO|nr:hypothetical protein Z043_104804 [Scleropages formosus]